MPADNQNIQQTPNHSSETELGLYEIARSWAIETNSDIPSKLRTLVDAVIYWLSFKQNLEKELRNDNNSLAPNANNKESILQKRNDLYQELEEESIKNQIYFLIPGKEPKLPDPGLFDFLTSIDANHIDENIETVLNSILIPKNHFYDWIKHKQVGYPIFWASQQISQDTIDLWKKGYKEKRERIDDISDQILNAASEYYQNNNKPPETYKDLWNYLYRNKNKFAEPDDTKENLNFNGDFLSKKKFKNRFNNIFIDKA